MPDEQARLRWEDLTEEDKKFLCNGCGGKGGLINPPEFLFEASCNRHDFGYWRGCDENHRHIVDRGFYEAMKRDAAKATTLYGRFRHRFWAWVYYRAVRIFGKKFFYYGAKQKTAVDLKDEKCAAALFGTGRIR